MRHFRHPAWLLALTLAGSPLSARPAATAEIEPFVVLSYNVENWLTTDRTVKNRHVASAPKPESEKDAVVGVIAAHQPAVLGIVEMGGRSDLEDLQARLKAKGLDYPNVEWHQGLDQDRHVALLSRFPIVERNSQDQVGFDLDGKPEGIQRGILDVTIEPAPGCRVRLIGLHLKSRRKVANIDEAALRAKEAWFVRQYVDAILTKDPKTRLLLYGDLNDTKEQYPIREILGPRRAPGRLTDIPVEDSRGERWTHYFKTADEYARIDFFMASPALLPQISRSKRGVDDSPQWSDASDHRAIFLTINPAGK